MFLSCNSWLRTKFSWSKCFWAAVPGRTSSDLELVLWTAVPGWTPIVPDSMVYEWQYLAGHQLFLSWWLLSWTTWRDIQWSWSTWSPCRLPAALHSFLQQTMPAVVVKWPEWVGNRYSCGGKEIIRPCIPPVNFAGQNVTRMVVNRIWTILTSWTL